MAPMKRSNVVRCSLLLRILKVYRTGIHSGYIQYTYRGFHIPHRIHVVTGGCFCQGCQCWWDRRLSDIAYSSLMFYLLELLIRCCRQLRSLIFPIPNTGKILINFWSNYVKKKQYKITCNYILTTGNFN